MRKIPWSRKWQPPPVFLPGASFGKRSLVATVHGVQRVGHDWATNTHTKINALKKISYIRYISRDDITDNHTYWMLHEGSEFLLPFIHISYLILRHSYEAGIIWILTLQIRKYTSRKCGQLFRSLIAGKYLCPNCNCTQIFSTHWGWQSSGSYLPGFNSRRLSEC